MKKDKPLIYWSRESERVLITLYNAGWTFAWIGKRLDRSFWAVAHKVKALRRENKLKRRER